MKQVNPPHTDAKAGLWASKAWDRDCKAEFHTYKPPKHVRLS